MPFRRILLFVATGARNVGDEMIVRAEYDFLRDRYPEAEIRVATYDATNHFLPKSDPRLAFFPYFPNGLRIRPFSNVGYFLRNVFETFRADLVIIGGGGLFYDNEGQNPSKQALEWKIRTFFARLFRKPLLFWGIGVDVRPENAVKFRGAFSGASAVTVRDPKSAATLSSIGIPSVVVPDPAFLFDVAAVLSDSEPPLRDGARAKPAVGISVRPGYLPGGLSDVRAIADAVSEAGFEPVFCHHSFHPSDAATDDAAYLDPLARELGIRSSRSMEETVGWYRDFAFCVSMRLHSGLLSVLSGVPPLVLSYSEKTRKFAELTGCASMDARNFFVSAFRTTFENLVSTREARIFAMTEKCATLRKNARTSFDAVFHGLESD